MSILSNCRDVKCDQTNENKLTDTLHGHDKSTPTVNYVLEIDDRENAHVGKVVLLINCTRKRRCLLSVRIRKDRRHPNLDEKKFLRS